MRRRTRALIDAATVMRTQGPFAGWTIGRIVTDAEDPVSALAEAAHGAADSVEVAAAQVFLNELRRHRHVLQIAAVHGGCNSGDGAGT